MHSHSPSQLSMTSSAHSYRCTIEWPSVIIALAKSNQTNSVVTLSSVSPKCRLLQFLACDHASYIPVFPKAVRALSRRPTAFSSTDGNGQIASLFPCLFFALLFSWAVGGDGHGLTKLSGNINHRLFSLTLRRWNDYLSEPESQLCAPKLGFSPLAGH